MRVLDMLEAVVDQNKQKATEFYDTVETRTKRVRRIRYENMDAEEKEIIKDSNKKWSSKSKEWKRTYATQHRGSSKEQFKMGMFYQIKTRCKRKGTVFELTKEDFLQLPDTGYCPLLETKLTWIVDKGRIATNYSLDRLDSNKGYTVDNVTFMSDRANILKQNATIEEILLIAKNIGRLHESRISSTTPNSQESSIL